VPLELRHVRVPVHDHRAAGKGSAKTLFPSCAGAGVVHDADPHRFDLHDPPLGQRRLQVRVIHVPHHRLHRPERGQLLERTGGDDVACVEYEVGLLQQAHALSRQSSSPARQMRVRDDRYERQRYYLRFGFALTLFAFGFFGFVRFGFAFFGVVTRKGLLTNTFVRVAFISACRNIATT
jgi:rRNA maturation protein Nop10